MANVSDWSANELENIFLDDMNLSDERGRRAAKIMAAVKAKEDEQDARLDAVAGGLVFRGTKATYAELEVVASPAVGDMYSVTDRGGENYAWNGTAWDSLGTSDANVVHKTGDESIAGEKTFTGNVSISKGAPIVNLEILDNTQYADVRFRQDDYNVAVIRKYFDGDLDIATNDYGSFWGNGPGIRLSLANKAVSITADGSDTCKVFNSSANKSFHPATNDAMSLGFSGLRWKQLFAVSGTIDTSDERAKTTISSIPDEVLDAWGDVSFLQFQMQSAVEKKGKEAARMHSGLIAQRIDEAFKARGFDASRYGLFCYDEWEAEPEQKDADGNVIRAGREAGSEFSLRYSEALCMEAAYQRRRASRLEARVAALEAILHGND